MKILLVRPKPHQDTIGLQNIMVCEPLELEYLAGAVKGEHQVELVDMILEKKPLSYFIRRYQPQVVAITAYISHVNVVKQYARTVKNIDSSIKVVVGGVHAEVVTEDFSDQAIDYVVYGNGIRTFCELLKQLETGEDQPLVGLMRRGETPVSCCNNETPKNLPDRNITARYRKRYYYMFHNPCALIKTSFGCPFSCNFCFCRQVTRGQYFTRDLEDVIAEIKQIEEPEIYIVDDNFLVDADRVDTFCELLKQNGIKKRFLIYGRADFIARHEDEIAKFAEVGLRAVIVGVESPHPEELTRYNKGSSVEINQKALEILTRNGIDCYAALILGLDWEQQHFDNLYKWLKQNNLRFINLQPLTPLPGTGLYNTYKDRLITPRERYERWDLATLVIAPERMSVRRYYINILKVYCKITFNTKSTLKNLKYGLLPCLKLSVGVCSITWQYFSKIIKGQ
jgi:hopanoid C-3 methylase